MSKPDKPYDTELQQLRKMNVRLAGDVERLRLLVARTAGAANTLADVLQELATFDAEIPF